MAESYDPRRDDRALRFNINGTVWVKLTDHGRSIMRELEHARPEEIDGWSEWQMWHLMKVFGPHLDQFGDLPFGANIVIIKWA